MADQGRNIVRIPLGGWDVVEDTPVAKGYDYYRAAQGPVKAALDKFIRFWDENLMQGFQGDMLRQIRSASRGPSEIEQIMERGLTGMSSRQMSEGRALISAFKNAVEAATPDWARAEVATDVKKVSDSRSFNAILSRVRSSVTTKARASIAQKIASLKKLDNAIAKVQDAVASNDMDRVESARSALLVAFQSEGPAGVDYSGLVQDMLF